MMRVKMTEEERTRMRRELNGRIREYFIDDHYTICSHLRLLYRTHLSDSQRELCEEIIFLAKKMSAKLEFYNNQEK